MDEIEMRIAALEQWLNKQEIDARAEQAHLEEGSRERLYWHYGYLVALKDVAPKGTVQ